MAGKEYTTAPILVNADGHPIPQYLDITDTTDSPQGTFKPLTQLQAEHPDVQNVQLTGSDVELLEKIMDINIPANTSIVIAESENYDYNYKKIRVGLYAASSTRGNYNLELVHKQQFGVAIDRKNFIDNNERAGVGSLDVYTPDWEVLYSNNFDEEITVYYLSVEGVK